MDIDVLVNQMDEHNEGSILLCQKIKPKEVYYLLSKGDEERLKSVKEYYLKNFKNVTLKTLMIDEGNINELEKFINNIKDKNPLVNITGGKRINSLILLHICMEKQLRTIYIDVKRKKTYEFNENRKMISEEFDDMDIEDIIKAAGGQIIEDSENLCYKEDLIYFSKQIYKHLPLWHKYKQRLYDNELFRHDSANPLRVYINKDNLLEEEEELISKIIKVLKDYNELQYKISDNEIIIDFNNNYIKGFIFKSGTWLEIATNNLIKKIDEIDQSKNGVVFLWDNNNKSVRNEVDVVAVKDAVPICISCKDSDKYNENALNELNVYAEKIGGANTIKILVATKEPIKHPVSIRAKEMGIHLIIFDGDENKFINEIKSILQFK